MKKAIVALAAIVVLLLAGIAVTSAQGPWDYDPYGPSYDPYGPSYDPYGPYDPWPGPYDPWPGPYDPAPGPYDPAPGPYDPAPGPYDPAPGPYDPAPAPAPSDQYGIGNPPAAYDPGDIVGTPVEAPTSATPGTKTFIGPVESAPAVSAPYAPSSRSASFASTVIIPTAPGPHIWINSPWGYVDNRPVSVRHGYWVRCLLRSRVGQTIYAWERYPSGWIDRQNWGYHWAGMYRWYFGADQRGVHSIAMYGTRTGWGNMLKVLDY